MSDYSLERLAEALRQSENSGKVMEPLRDRLGINNGRPPTPFSS